MVDVQNAGEALLQDTQFMELFQRALGGEEHLKDIPPDGHPEREKWLRDMQKKIREECVKSTKSKLEEIQSDKDGQWMYILPDPGFCVKCTTTGGGKVFVNVCQHKRIAEPIPMDDEESSDEVKFRIPLSCGQARPETDKSGKPCKVYDVIVNPSTIQRCSKDHEFRCFVVSLCIHWIKQKSEPTLNSGEYRNMNFKVKGVLEPQRIRLSSVPKAANALGDEIQLPQNSNAASPLTSVGGRSGTGKLIQELSESSSSAVPAAAPPPPQEGEAAKPSLVKLQGEGFYDWSRHTKPMLNPYMRENIPSFYALEIYVPTVTTIAEVEVRLTPRLVELLYVDTEDSVPFLTVPLDYPIDDNAPEAKFIRKKHLLKMKLSVRLPDETSEPATKADRDVTEVEEEETRLEREQREKELLEYRQRVERQRQEEESVMRERRSYVENLAAVQEGEMPPSLKEEVDKLPQDQLGAMLQRLESRTCKGDSIDLMLEKFPDTMIDAICRYIRSQLGLVQRPTTGNAKTMPDGDEDSGEAAKPLKSHDSAATATTTTTTTVTSVQDPMKQDDEGEGKEGRVDYNFAKKAERLLGVAFHNRYLFALD